MKIVTSTAALIATTNIVQSAVAGGDEANLPSHFLFRIVEGVLHILASNGKRLLASASVEGATVEGDPQTFTVSAWRFGQLLRLSPDTTAVLNFDETITSTKVNIGGRTIRLASLDPSQFNYWDDTFTNTQVTATVKAGRLFAALNYVRPFVSTFDTRTPSLAATECREGTLWATDSNSVASVAVAGLEKSSLRIHFSDISAVNAFLGLDPDIDITVREHPSTIFFVRPDGGVFGVSRWVHAFPNMKLDRTTKASFTLDTASLRFGIRFLAAASAKGDDKIRFDFSDDKTVISVKNAITGTDKAAAADPAKTAEWREEFELDTKALNNITALSEINRTSFDLNTNHLTAILDLVTDLTVTFEVNWTAKNGYVLYKSTVDGDEYVTIAVWRK